MQKESGLCPACHEGLDESESCVQVEESLYHMHCFLCSQCKEPLANQNYFFEEGQFLCEKDYQSLYGRHCALCHEFISSSFIEDQSGKAFHSSCIVCSNCKNSLVNGHYELEGHYLCVDCYGQARPEIICAMCSQAIEGEAVKFRGHNYHAQCLLCDKCGKSIPRDREYIEMNGRAHHIQCALIKCAYCNTQIKNGQAYIQNEDQTCLHKECDTKLRTPRPQPVASVQHHDNPYKRQHFLDTAGGEEEEEEEEQEEEQEQEEQKKSKQNGNYKSQGANGQLNQALGKMSLGEEEGAKKHAFQQVRLKPAQEQHAQQGNSYNKQQQQLHNPAKNYVVQKNDAKIIQQAKAQFQQLHLDANRPRFPYSELIKKQVPFGVDAENKEAYLTDEEFQKVFQMTWNEFQQLKKWRQIEKKKEKNLF